MLLQGFGHNAPLNMAGFGQGNWTDLAFPFVHWWSNELALLNLILITLSFFFTILFLFNFPCLALPTLFCLSNPLLLFPSLPSQHAFPLQLGLWSRQCLKLNLLGTPLSCTATWSATQLRRSSGGMLRSTEGTPSSSYGTEPANVASPSTRPMAPMESVCWASHASQWKTLGPMSAGPATTPSAMTYDKTLPWPGFVPRPPLWSYKVSGLYPVAPRRWTTNPKTF